MNTVLSQSQQAMTDQFAKHMNAELSGDIKTTMATMTMIHILIMFPQWQGETVTKV